MVLVYHVGAGGQLIGGFGSVKGETKSRGLIGVVVKVPGSVPVIGGQIQAPDIANKLVRLQPSAALAVGGGGGVQAFRIVNAILAVGNSAFLYHLIVGALYAIHIQVGNLGVAVKGVKYLHSRLGMLAGTGNRPQAHGNPVGGSQGGHNFYYANLIGQVGVILLGIIGLQIGKGAKGCAGFHKGGGGLSGVYRVRLDKAFLHPVVHGGNQVLVLVGLIQVYNGGILSMVGQNTQVDHLVAYRVPVPVTNVFTGGDSHRPYIFFFFLNHG